MAIITMDTAYALWMAKITHNFHAATVARAIVAACEALKVSEAKKGWGRRGGEGAYRINRALQARAMNNRLQETRTTMAMPLSMQLRRRWVMVGDYFDRWYEELPWRRQVPLGRRGEDIAVRHLRRSGSRILERNFRAGGAEIDLIAADHETLVFVEVKARSSAGFGVPAEAVDARKSERIRRAATLYLRQNHAEERPARFDIIAIVGAGRACRLELLKDAF
jgi:putative endonuclease